MLERVLNTQLLYLMDHNLLCKYLLVVNNVSLLLILKIYPPTLKVTECQ